MSLARGRFGIEFDPDRNRGDGASGLRWVVGLVLLAVAVPKRNEAPAIAGDKRMGNHLRNCLCCFHCKQYSTEPQLPQLALVNQRIW